MSPDSAHDDATLPGRSPLRVLFLTLYPPCAASTRHRVAQFIPYLESHGVQATVLSALTEEQYAWARARRPFWYHLVETFQRFTQLLSARCFDVVFLQKAVMTAYLRGMAGLARLNSRRLIFDLDDAVHLAPPHPLRGLWRMFEEPAQSLRLMARATLVLAGNRWLAEVATRAGAKAALFPTVVDTERFVPAADPPRGSNTVRIGWIGSPSTTPYLQPVAEALVGIGGAETVLVGADPARVSWPGADIRPWSLDTEVAELRAFSIGLMPLPRTEWAKGKCALKALQYMACGIPCVATPYGAALDVIQHGRNGLLADTPGEWRDAVAQLRDPAERRRLGEAGRATVESGYSLRHAAPRMLRLLRGAA